MRHWVLLLSIACLAACETNSLQRPDQYYSLVLANNTQRAKLAAPVRHWTLVPIRLPEYLKGQNIALQTAPNRIEAARRHFWAEPLDEGIAKVLVADIERLLEDVAIEREAGRWTPVLACRLRVEFAAFHATHGGQVEASGRYWLAAGETITRQQFDESAPLAADGYAHAVDALRTLLDVLAAQIAAALEGVACD